MPFPIAWLAALPPSERPRERLLALGGEALHDAELYALVLGAGSHGHDALATGMLLAQRYPELRRLLHAGIAELAAIPGMGVTQACRIKAALALASRLDARPLVRGESFSGPEDLVRRVGASLRCLEREVFITIALDVKHRVLGARRLAEGGVTAVSLDPKDVMVWLVREGAAGMVIVHNHPSGDPTPSDSDVELTRRLAAAGELLGIPLVDHLVVAQGGSYSFVANGPAGAISGQRGSGR